MHREYMNNKRFSNYVDKYAKNRGISVNEALQHELVRQVYLYYAEERRKTE